MSATQIANKGMKQEHFRKTKMCTFYQEARCRYGDSCAFAHGHVEVEVLPDLTKTSLCLSWKAGTCHLSAANCRFAHGKKDLRVFLGHQQGPQGVQDDDQSMQPTTSQNDSFLLSAPHLQPVKLPPPPTRSPLDEDLEPMKVQLPCQDRWEADTVSAWTSHDGDKSFSSTSLHSTSDQAQEDALANLSQHMAEMALFDVDIDHDLEVDAPAAAKRGTLSSAVGSSASSGYHLQSSATRPEVPLAQEFHGFSTFSGMPRLF